MILSPTILPNKIAGVTMWIDADDMSTIGTGSIITDGTAITTIKCKVSGNVFTGNATYKVGVVAANRGTLWINSQVLTTSNAPLTDVKSVFVVFKMVAIDATFRYFFTMRDVANVSVNPDLSMIASTSTGLRYLECNAAHSIVIDWQTAVSDTNTHIFTKRGNATLLHKLKFDRTSAFQAATVTGHLTATNTMNLGSASISAGNANIYMCEVIVANTNLSDVSYNAIRRYLFNKWGV